MHGSDVSRAGFDDDGVSRRSAHVTGWAGVVSGASECGSGVLGCQARRAREANPSKTTLKPKGHNRPSAYTNISQPRTQQPDRLYDLQPTIVPPTLTPAAIVLQLAC